MENIENLSRLIDLHLNDDKSTVEKRNWFIKKSYLSGRGVFAKNDIQAGEIIFHEKPLIIGPTGQKGTKLNTCTICYTLLDDNVNNVCEKGCSLPVCKDCSCSEQHLRECKLYKEWKPIDTDNINQNSLRLLTIARGLFLNKNEKDLLYELQSNNDPSYKTEILKASKCFKEFPNDRETLEYFNRIVSVLNTNAFEALCKRKSYEISLRGLYPLAGIMNHECTPNSAHEFNENNIIIVKACKFIPKDTEITTTYSLLLWNNISRNIFLTVTKGFTCICSRCCDPTENGTFLSAIFCRKNGCFGIVIPNDCVGELWKCMKCNEIYDINHVTKIQNFSLNAINSKIISSNIKELIEFINERIPKICPESNQLTLEAKLSVIWGMNKIDNQNENFNEQDYRNKIRYCEEIIEILNKLEAGECTLKKLLTDEIEKTKCAVN